ncbi:MAG TPA: hypothetical protein VNJ08_11115 [Bacteriovoracaceae bacterium]|nr:hypothetical protein [Bacteriovoracaceae bacterium]
MRKQFRTFTNIGMLGILIGCAHELTPVAISPTADPHEEIVLQEAFLEHSRKLQVDMLAPERFDVSISYLKRAQKGNRKGESREEILDLLGYSKAHLYQARKEADTMRVRMPGILKSRKAALKAGSPCLQAEMKSLDQKLKGFTEAGGAMTPQEMTSLQKDYLNLELTCIKNSRLITVLKILDEARKENAERIIPQAYAKAIKKFNLAEKLIEKDRYGDVLINNAIHDASISAKRMVFLLQSEQRSRI